MYVADAQSMLLVHDALVMQAGESEVGGFARATRRFLSHEGEKIDKETENDERNGERKERAEKGNGVTTEIWIEISGLKGLCPTDYATPLDVDTADT